MTFYSVMPAEIVFQESYDQNKTKYFEAGYKGEKVIVVQLPDGKYSIDRLLSTSPCSFLNPAFQPGSLVDARELEIK